MRTLLLLALTPTLLFAQPPDTVRFADTKRAALATIDSHANDMTALSDEVWRYAETALKETRSSKALADWAEAKGFRVTRGVANLPTAFVAEFGSGKPVIGIMGEYDALPGISQKAQPTKDGLEAGAPGQRLRTQSLRCRIARGGPRLRNEGPAE
jgi:aminobenzoyl-glutamate utilization protein B